MSSTGQRSPDHTPSWSTFEDLFNEELMFMSQTPSLSFSSAPSDLDAEMGGQDPRAAGLGPAQASHGQPRPTPSEDTNPLRQHDQGYLLLGITQDSASSVPFDLFLTRMYCATPRRGLLGEKQARR
jgi:hypothetical protein